MLFAVLLTRIQCSLMQPTFEFFHDGKKATEVVGADKQQLEAAFKNLYK